MTGALRLIVWLYARARQVVCMQEVTHKLLVSRQSIYSYVSYFVHYIMLGTKYILYEIHHIAYQEYVVCSMSGWLVLLAGRGD